MNLPKLSSDGLEFLSFSSSSSYNKSYIQRYFFLFYVSSAQGRSKIIESAPGYSFFSHFALLLVSGRRTKKLKSTQKSLSVRALNHATL